MTTLTIEIPDKSSQTLIDLVGQLGGKVVNPVLSYKKAAAREYQKKYQIKEVSKEEINEDTTAYLNQSEANRKRLLKAVDEVSNSTSEERNKKQILKDLKDAVSFVNKHKNGKVQAQSINESLDEL